MKAERFSEAGRTKKVRETAPLFFSSKAQSQHPISFSLPGWARLQTEALTTRYAISGNFIVFLFSVLARIPAQFLRYGLVLFFNVTMWGCYINSLKALSSLQATVTNFATNFLSSGVAGFFLFQESLPSRWFAGAFFIIIGVFILSKSNIEKKPSQD